MSALRPNAALCDVRFTPQSGHWLSVSECQLCAKSGRQAGGETGLFRR
jgi:hypothetical protein